MTYVVSGEVASMHMTCIHDEGGENGVVCRQWKREEYKAEDDFNRRVVGVATCESRPRLSNSSSQ